MYKQKQQHRKKNTNLLINRCANKPGPALPLGMGRLGSSPITIPPSLGSAYLGRTYLSTWNLPGVYSRISVTTSPIFFAPVTSSAGSITCSFRGRCEGSGRRTGDSFSFAGFFLVNERSSVSISGVSYCEMSRPKDNCPGSSWINRSFLLSKIIRFNWASSCLK